MLSNTLPLNSSTALGTPRRSGGAGWQRHGGDSRCCRSGMRPPSFHQPHQQVRQRAFAGAVGPVSVIVRRGAMQRDAIQRRRPARVGERTPSTGCRAPAATHGLPGGEVPAARPAPAQALQRAARAWRVCRRRRSDHAHRAASAGLQYSRKLTISAGDRPAAGLLQLPQDQHLRAAAARNCTPGPSARRRSAPLLVAQAQDASGS